MNAFKSFANEALERSWTASDALKYACHNWAVHLSRAPRPWDDTLNRMFQVFCNDHMISWLEMEWCLKGLRSCLGILSDGQKLAKFEPVNAQPNKVLSAIDPDLHPSTREASALASTSEMLTRGPSAQELVDVNSVPNPHSSTQSPPSTSTSPLAPPLPPVPSPTPNTAVLQIGTSRKRVLDEFRFDSGGQLESNTPSPLQVHLPLKFMPNRTV
jgi:hypothetical protein